MFYEISNEVRFEEVTPDVCSSSGRTYGPSAFELESTHQFLIVFSHCRYPAHMTLLRGNHESRQITQVSIDSLGLF